MAKLIYFMPTSLDGYIADEPATPIGRPRRGGICFHQRSRASHRHVSHGHEICETMAIWETPDVIPGLTPGMLDFARIWQAADKIVYSTSLEIVSTRRAVSSENSTRRRFAT